MAHRLSAAQPTPGAICQLFFEHPCPHPEKLHLMIMLDREVEVLEAVAYEECCGLV